MDTDGGRIQFRATRTECNEPVINLAGGRNQSGITAGTLLDLIAAIRLHYRAGKRSRSVAEEREEILSRNAHAPSPEC